MSAMSSLEYKRDFAGERYYASRNYNHFRHTVECPGANRGQFDWTITLRQVRKRPNRLGKSHSLPSFHPPREKEVMGTTAHSDGPYLCHSSSLGKYQNYFDTRPFVEKVIRVSGGVTPHNLDWQLNLRDSMHAKSESPDKWRRHFAKGHASFDMMAENCSPSNEEYQKSHITPLDRRPDRRTAALPIEMIRDTEEPWRRHPGCEGVDCSKWRHLIEDRSRGHKVRRHLAFETSLRQGKEDPTCGALSDNRSDASLVEWLGKKRWYSHESPDPMAARPPDGDPKLHYLSKMKVPSERDEEIRKLRSSKQPRADANICERDTSKKAVTPRAPAPKARSQG